VIVCNDIHIHEYNGVKTPIDSTEMLLGLKKFITLALEKPKDSNHERVKHLQPCEAGH
jgi:hypothetical protein